MQNQTFLCLLQICYVFLYEKYDYGLIFLLDVYSKDIFEFLVFWAMLAKKTIRQRLSHFLQ